eukprot:gene24627-10249_t
MGCTSSSPVERTSGFAEGSKVSSTFSLLEEQLLSLSRTNANSPNDQGQILCEPAKGKDDKGISLTKDVPAPFSNSCTLSRSACDYVLSTLFSSQCPSSRSETFISDTLEGLSIIGATGTIKAEFSRNLLHSAKDVSISATMSHDMEGIVVSSSKSGSAPFMLKRLIGRGGYGFVFDGEWNGLQVAVKVTAGKSLVGMTPEQGEAESQRMHKVQMESILMSMLSHDNIVRTHEVVSGCDKSPAAAESCSQVDLEPSKAPCSYYIIMEHAQNGSLQAGLQAGLLHGSSSDIELLGPGLVMWDAWAALETLKDIARGLLYLHAQGVIHADVKCANVLLCKPSSSDLGRRGYTARISDFGLSCVIPQYARSLRSSAETSTSEAFSLRMSYSLSLNTGSFGTVTHMPPELISRGILSPACDIYSFGMVMWEVLTGLEAFPDISDEEIIKQAAVQGIQSHFPADGPVSFVALAQLCLSPDPRRRPNALAILNFLEALQLELCPFGSHSPDLILLEPTQQSYNTPAVEAPEPAVGFPTSTVDAPKSAVGSSMPSVGDPRPAVRTHRSAVHAPKPERIHLLLEPIPSRKPWPTAPAGEKVSELHSSHENSQPQSSRDESLKSSQPHSMIYQSCSATLVDSARLVDISFSRAKLYGEEELQYLVP